MWTSDWGIILSGEQDSNLRGITCSPVPGILQSLGLWIEQEEREGGDRQMQMLAVVLLQEKGHWHLLGMDKVLSLLFPPPLTGTMVWGVAGVLRGLSPSVGAGWAGALWIWYQTD